MTTLDLHLLDKILHIHIPIKYNKIGIAMSGGMDSTLLAYYLLKEIDHKKVVVYTVDLGNSYEYVNRILDELNVICEVRLINNPKNPNGVLSPIFTKALDEVDYFYTGTTMNPEWADKIPEGQKPYRYIKTEWKNMHMPFGTSLKTNIVDLYYQEQLFDLLKLTHTCTEKIDSHCGLCFACRERWWAFNKLGLQDCVEYETHEAFTEL